MARQQLSEARSAQPLQQQLVAGEGEQLNGLRAMRGGRERGVQHGGQRLFLFAFARGDEWEVGRAEEGG